MLHFHYVALNSFDRLNSQATERKKGEEEGTEISQRKYGGRRERGRQEGWRNGEGREKRIEEEKHTSVVKLMDCSFLGWTLNP
jgi:hypothetical protein